MKQVLIGNIKYSFDYMTDIISIEGAKKEFPYCDYLGTSSVIYINGIKHLLERQYRFFKSRGIVIKNTLEQQEKFRSLTEYINKQN